MVNKLLRCSRDQKGFTMVELMVVIVIIGVLSAIALPTFNAQIDKAKVGRAVADLKSVKNLVELYYVENGKYPDVEKFEDQVNGNGLVWKSSDNPMKDPWGRAYYYYVNSDGSSYVLLSEGPEEGDAEDNIVASAATQEPLTEQNKPTNGEMDESVSYTPAS